MRLMFCFADQCILISLDSNNLTIVTGSIQFNVQSADHSSHRNSPSRNYMGTLSESTLNNLQ